MLQFGELPAALQSVATQPLLVISLEVRPFQILGATPAQFRRVGVVPRGLFEGSRLSGEVLEGGSDWQTIRADGATQLDVRLVLKTQDGALIGMTYQGIRHGPRETIAKLDAGERIDRRDSRMPIRVTTGSIASSPWVSAIGHF